MTKYKELGYKGYKIHGGSRNPRDMIALCTVVRKAVGEDMKLMLDTGPDPRIDSEGYVHAPRTPGLGFELDWERIRSLQPRIVS